MKFDESRTTGKHHELSRLCGEWSGSTKTWFEPDTLADESPMTGRIREVLGGRFVIHEYAGSIQGKPFEGMAIYGFDLNTGKFQSAWIDSFHMFTGIMFSEGTWGEGISLLGHYHSGGETSEKWGWRTLIEIVNYETIVITAFNVSPDGEEAKATETRYKRVS